MKLTDSALSSFFNVSNVLSYLRFVHCVTSKIRDKDDSRDNFFFALLYLIDLLLCLLTVSSVGTIGECDDETSLRIQPETCCDFGTFWAASGLTCIKFLGSNAAIPDQQVRCVENMNKCCGQAYRAQSCEKGKKNAWAGFHCAKNGKSKNPANNQQRACCEACQYGESQKLKTCSNVL